MSSTPARKVAVVALVTAALIALAIAGVRWSADGDPDRVAAPAVASPAPTAPPPPTATPEPTPTATPEPTPTAAPEPPPTATPEPTPTATPEPTPTATPEPTPTATPEPTPTATPEPTPTATPEPTPTATPEPTPTATPEPTPTATPEPTPTATPVPVDRSWAPAGSLDGATDEEVAWIRELYEADLWEWDVLLKHWYPLTYVDSNGETQVWEPPFPGAPRLLTSFGYLGGSASLGSGWVTLVPGLELPPALVRYTLTNPFPPRPPRYDPSVEGFYPPLEPGVNVVWVAGADFTDPSQRPECPVITRMEELNTDWMWPTAARARSHSISSYEQYRELMDYTGIPVESGRGRAWSEEHNAAFYRLTESTPYGWYTFDIETMEMRPVDTAPDSWDTLNLWGSEVPYALGFGATYYNHIYGVTLPQGIEPWPPFDPWAEVLQRGEAPTVPGPYTHALKSFVFESPNPRGEGYGAYMRITCE